MVRILFIGFDELPQNTSAEYFRAWGKKESDFGRGEWDESISIFDYNVVFLNTAKPPTRLAQDLGPFLDDGGVFCVFVSKANANCVYQYIKADPTHFGQAISFSRNWICEILRKKEHGFQWSAVLSKGEYIARSELAFSLLQFYKTASGQVSKPARFRDYREVAFSPNGKCVCAMVTIGRGKILALPSPGKISPVLLREILDGIEDNLIGAKKGVVKGPSWLSSVLMPGEESLQSRLAKIKDSWVESYSRLLELSKPKGILYLSGRQLTEAVSEVFERMSIHAEMREDKGREDLQIDLEGLRGIIEVKGLKGHASVDHIRQLLHWWIDAAKTAPGVKGIFIVNHYKHIEPSKREAPYTPEAVELGSNNKFCLMTTLDMLEMLKGYLQSRVTPRSVVGTIFDTVGLLEYPTDAGG